ncbi:DUF309 domain-containing protein [Salinibacillus xinjiangensis]|uniref:DUF309 domain-containing protein n=1 Tax=Salinibacillus xinjiangensis TaxID=1229268 RepID=A0A6G1X6M1_9BACI|nr:DUF309 domain-containing protein [Salinibacillus xinjiangensis]MRG86458.1 DUF309 domain-containing protein [Salinibacillus xinjiangensis]
MYDEAYIEYLTNLLGTRDYFECHEILEEHWKKELPLDRHSIWVAFIQLAVSLYHQRRGNMKGALRLITKSIHKFHLHENKIEHYGLDKEKLLQLLDTLKLKIENQQPYQSIFLPIKDQKLIKLVKAKCQQLNCTFHGTSNLSDEYLVHKHIMRHRK